MRRGILFLIILAVLALFAWQVVLKPKPKSTTKSKKAAKVKTEKTEESGIAKTSRKRPKKAGKLKRLSKEERKAERERLRAEKKRRKAELRRRKKEERLAKKAAKKRSKGKSTRKKGVSAYVVQAIIWFDAGPSYVMIDGRRYEVGEIVQGRKIVVIKQDQIVVDYRGTQTVVRMGESILPSGYYGTERRRRR